MITLDTIGDYEPGQYELVSAGFMGVYHVLTAKDLSLIGEADVLAPNLPVTVIRLTRTVFGRRWGEPQYIAIQPGRPALLMREGDEERAIYQIMFDSAEARKRARRIIRQG